MSTRVFSTIIVGTKEIQKYETTGTGSFDLGSTYGVR